MPAGRLSQPPFQTIPAEPIHERTTWHSASPPSGTGSLWQSLSAACGASLAALLAGELPSFLQVPICMRNKASKDASQQSFGGQNACMLSLRHLMLLYKQLNGRHAFPFHTERGEEGTSLESTADGVVRQARVLAWGVDSAGPALLCALCSALAAEYRRTNDQVGIMIAAYQFFCEEMLFTFPVLVGSFLCAIGGVDEPMKCLIASCLHVAD